MRVPRIQHVRVPWVLASSVILELPVIFNKPKHNTFSIGDIKHGDKYLGLSYTGSHLAPDPPASYIVIY